MRKLPSCLSCLICLICLQTAHLSAVDREYVSVVASHEVASFSTILANDFKMRGKVAPQVDQINNKLGIDFLCAGNGLDTPDMLIASRQMTDAEKKACEANQVTALEFHLGKDAAVLVSAKANKTFTLTPKHLYLALAKYVPDDTNKLVLNNHLFWSDIDPSLPDQRIIIYGPENESTARKSLVESGVEAGCQSFEQLAKIAASNPRQYDVICKSIRQDGAWRTLPNVEMAIRSLLQNDDAIALMMNSDLLTYGSLLEPIAIDAVLPTAKTIDNNQYPLVQGIYLYVKQDHLKTVANVEQLMNMFLSHDVLDEGGSFENWGFVSSLHEQSNG